MVCLAISLVYPSGSIEFPRSNDFYLPSLRLELGEGGHIPVRYPATVLVFILQSIQSSCVHFAINTKFTLTGHLTNQCICLIYFHLFCTNNSCFLAVCKQEANWIDICLQELRQQEGQQASLGLFTDGRKRHSGTGTVHYIAYIKTKKKTKMFDVVRNTNLPVS